MIPTAIVIAVLLNSAPIRAGQALSETERATRIMSAQQRLLELNIAGADRKQLDAHARQAIGDGVPPAELEPQRARDAVIQWLATRLEQSPGHYPEQHHVFARALELNIPRELIRERANLSVFEAPGEAAKQMRLLDEFLVKAPNAVSDTLSVPLELSTAVPATSVRTRIQELVLDTRIQLHIRKRVLSALNGDMFGGSDRFLVALARNVSIPVSLRQQAMGMLSWTDLTIPNDVAVFRAIADTPGNPPGISSWAAGTAAKIARAHPQTKSSSMAEAVIDPKSAIPLRTAIESLDVVQADLQPALKIRLREVVLSSANDKATRFSALGALARQFGRADELGVIQDALRSDLAPDFGQLLLSTLAKRSYLWREQGLTAALQSVVARDGPLRKDAEAVLNAFQEAQTRSNEINATSPANRSGR